MILKLIVLLKEGLEHQLVDFHKTHLKLLSLLGKFKTHASILFLPYADIIAFI